MENARMHQHVGTENTAILPELWRRRTQLSRDEMARVYNIVRGALRTYYPPELQSLHDDKEELIAQFLYSKVFRLEPGQSQSHSSADSAPSNNYAICAYFRRYLVDCLRSAAHQHNVSMEINGIAQEVDAQARMPDDRVAATLTQYGLDETGVRNCAREFISSLDEHDRIVLAGSLGWCSERKGGLSGVAMLHHIPSYHYRALKLGVTVKKTAQPIDFKTTKIGRWISNVVGVSITVENKTAILLILAYLAAESFDPDNH